MRRFGGVVVALIAGYLLLPVLVSNLITVALTRPMQCTRYVESCIAGVSDMTTGWQNQPAVYAGLTTFVGAVRQLSFYQGDLPLRHAELLAAQGKFAEAAALLEPLPLPEYHYSDELEIGVAPSRLLVNGLPENAILAAHQQAAQGATDTAITALRIAIATAPELLGEAEWALYAELTGSTAPQSTTPTAATVEYPLAASGTWRGMDIIGVAVDTTTFRENGSGWLMVWLRVQSETTPPEGIAQGNGTWLIPYRGVNLAPNPGFEWGSATIHNGTIPQGYFALVNHNGTQDIGFPVENGNTRLRVVGSALQSFSSYPIAVEPDALYLMGATVSTTGTFTLGRRCIPTDVYFSRDGLWAYPLHNDDVRSEWSGLATPQRVATIGTAAVTPNIATCQFIFESAGGESLIDDLFFMKLEP